MTSLICIWQFVLRMCRYLYRHRQYRHINIFFQYRHINYQQTSENIGNIGISAIIKIGISAKMSYRHVLNLSPTDLWLLSRWMCLNSHSTNTWPKLKWVYYHSTNTRHTPIDLSTSVFESSAKLYHFQFMALIPWANNCTTFWQAGQ